MFIAHIHIQVKPESLAAFQAATLANARASVQEPGVARFDVLQHLDNPTHFTLVEVYVDEAANLAHKQTPHYFTWRDTVADMMAAPRSPVKYRNLFPGEEGWRS